GAKLGTGFYDTLLSSQKTNTHRNQTLNKGPSTGATLSTGLIRPSLSGRRRFPAGLNLTRSVPRPQIDGCQSISVSLRPDPEASPASLNSAAAGGTAPRTVTRPASASAARNVAADRESSAPRPNSACEAATTCSASARPWTSEHTSSASRRCPARAAGRSAVS